MKTDGKLIKDASTYKTEACRDGSRHCRVEEPAELTSNWKNHTKLYSHQVYINHRPQEVAVGDGDGDGVVADVALSAVCGTGKGAHTQNNRRKSVKNCRP